MPCEGMEIKGKNSQVFSRQTSQKLGFDREEMALQLGLVS